MPDKLFISEMVLYYSNSVAPMKAKPNERHKSHVFIQKKLVTNLREIFMISKGRTPVYCIVHARASVMKPCHTMVVKNVFTGIYEQVCLQNPRRGEEVLIILIYKPYQA